MMFNNDKNGVYGLRDLFRKIKTKNVVFSTFFEGLTWCDFPMVGGNGVEGWLLTENDGKTQ